MKKSLFIKKEIKKTINIKNNKATVKFKIYNYNEASKKAIFDLYEKKQKQGIDDFSLSNEELRLVLNMFTDCLFSLDELAEILENPSSYFEQIMNELEIVLSELVVLYIQDQTKKIMSLKIEEAIIDFNATLAEKAKSLEIDKLKDGVGNMIEEVK